MLFLFPSVGRGSHLRLARGAGPCRCAPHSHPPNPASFVFHPPDPPIALQSISRDAPFSQGGDGETQCLKVHSGRSPGWIKFAEPSGDTALRFAPRVSSEGLSTSTSTCRPVINASVMEENELAPSLAWIVTALEEEQEGREDVAESDGRENACRASARLHRRMCVRSLRRRPTNQRTASQS